MKDRGAVWTIGQSLKIVHKLCGGLYGFMHNFTYTEMQLTGNHCVESVEEEQSRAASLCLLDSKLPWKSVFLIPWLNNPHPTK